MDRGTNHVWSYGHERGVSSPERTRRRETSRGGTVSISVLMRAYLDGDHQAFSALLCAIRPRLLRVARAYARDVSSAEDIVQQALLKCHACRESFDLSRSRSDQAVVSWYTTIVRNTALDHVRAQQVRRRFAQSLHGLHGQLDVADPAAEIEAHCIHRETEAILHERLDRALSQLTPGQRAVVELHKFAGLSFEEAARALDTRSSTLRARAHRAYRTLARSMLTARGAELPCSPLRRRALASAED